MSDTTKFWIQTLIIPIVLAVTGYYINNTLQTQQRAFEKIKFADQVINEAFDSDNPDKALALTKIIPVLIDDKEFCENLITLVNNYYIKKAELALKTSNEVGYKQISDAAAAFDGDGITISESLRLNPKTKGAEKAHDLEQKGLAALQLGNLEAAQQNFEKANDAHPAFKASNEISHILEQKIDDVKQGADQQQVQQQALEKIERDYSDKLNPKVAALRLNLKEK
jgi:tetratricopeptide (TPR) repeat protein